MTVALFSDIFYPLVLCLVAGGPLLVALGCCPRKFRRAGWNLLPWTTAPALFAGLIIPGEMVVRVPWFFMGGLMGIDRTSRIFLCISALIWLLAASTVKEAFQRRQGGRRFSGYFLAAMAGNFGLILARDMLGFYLFFAIMSFAAYGMIAHDRTPEARRAGRIYLIAVMVGEVAMFTALALIFFKTRSQSLAEVAGITISLPTLILLFIAFGVKVGALPFQFWMPPAYQQTPIPGATALAGAMVNAGLLGWLRFIPLGHMASGGGALLFITAGGLAAIYGVIYGLGRSKAGEVLASSSMSQMGLMTLIVGLGLCSPEAGRYALFLLPLFAVHHSLAKGSMFLSYDFIDKGGSPGRYLLLIVLLLPSFSLAGLPFTGGAVVKTGLKELALISGGDWYARAKFFLPLSSIGTTVLMLHCSRIIRRKKAGGAGREVLKWPWLTALAGTACWFLIWPAAVKLRSHSLDFSMLFHSFWPVAAGVGLTLLFFFLTDRFKGKVGILFPEFGFGKKVASLGAALPARIGDLTEKFYPVSAIAGKWPALSPGSPLARNLRKPEKVLGRWSMVGLFYLAVCIFLLFLLFYT